MISIKGSNPKLLPDLTAAVDVQLEALDNVLCLPRESVVMQEGRAMVNVLVNGRPEPRAVKLGSMNDCEVVIESGLEEGLTVMRNPHIAAGAGKLPE